MKRAAILLTLLLLNVFAVCAQEKSIAVLVTTKNIPNDVNTQPAIDAFMKALSRSEYKVVDRTAAVLQALDVERDFQALYAAREEMARIGKAKGAKYVCNIDISFLPYDKQYYFSVHMVDTENTEVDCVTYYPENSLQSPIQILSRAEMQRVSLYLIRDLNLGLNFMTQPQINAINDEIKVIERKWKDPIKVYNDRMNRKAMVESIIPGLGLIHKGYTAEGVSYLIGDIALVGGGIGSIVYANGQREIMNSRESDYKAYTTAEKNLNIANTSSIVCFSAAAALYVVNLIRGYTAKGLKHSKFEWKVVPTASINTSIKEQEYVSAGFALTFNF